MLRGRNKYKDETQSAEAGRHGRTLQGGGGSSVSQDFSMSWSWFRGQEWGSLGGDSAWVSYVSTHLVSRGTASVLSYFIDLFKMQSIAMEGRKSVSLWSKGQTDMLTP